MKVQLMLTCLCDAFYGEVGIAAVRVLEHAGCTVEFAPAQTCCGQPPYNAGDWAAARRIADHAKQVFGALDSPIVCGSASCTAMLREGYELLYPGEPHLQAYELSEFLLSVVKVTEWPKLSPAPRVAFHRSCHGRGIGLGDSAERLLRMAGVELVPFEDADQCCGFGGAFSVTHPKVSGEIGLEKLHRIADADVLEIVSGDMGCLMHLGGLIQRQKMPYRTRHYAELLAAALPVKEATVATTGS
ncbi:MAG: (Fe-S)-binding protein [Fimbriimonadaceae bacterium]